MREHLLISSCHWVSESVIDIFPVLRLAHLRVFQSYFYSNNVISHEHSSVSLQLKGTNWNTFADAFYVHDKLSFMWLLGKGKFSTTNLTWTLIFKQTTICTNMCNAFFFCWEITICILYKYLYTWRKLFTDTSRSLRICTPIGVRNLPLRGALQNVIRKTLEFFPNWRDITISLT